MIDNLFRLPAAQALPALTALRDQIEARIEVLRLELAGSGRWPQLEPTWDTLAVLRRQVIAGKWEMEPGDVQSVAEYLKGYYTDPNEDQPDEAHLIDPDKVDWTFVARQLAA